MTSKQKQPEAQNPLILRSHRLMEAFAKSDDERDFYLDRLEGFIIYVNLDKTEDEIKTLIGEVELHPERYCMIPKLTFFETKKIMEGFVNEKVYDIDTKEKLLDIIQSKEAREHFLEFIYDHHSELEKWQQYYQERSRIRIIEWLRSHNFNFVFEEDLDLSTKVIEKLKENLFTKEVPREIEVARKSLVSKAKTYYSNEALNPRPKRGRPPKQTQKLEMEPQVTTDIYTTVPSPVRPFLFTPEIISLFDVTFSTRFETGQELMAHRKQAPDHLEFDESLTNISQKLASLRELSSKWLDKEKPDPTLSNSNGFDELEESEDEPLIEDHKLLKMLEERKQVTKNKLPSVGQTKTDKSDQKTITQLSLKQDKKEAIKKKIEDNKASVKKRIVPPETQETSPSKKTAKLKPTPPEKNRKIMPPLKKESGSPGQPEKSVPPQKRPLRKTNEKK